MIKGIIDTIKANKGTVIKRTLLIGGAALATIIVAKVVTKRGDDEEEIELAEAGEVKDLETDESKSEIENG